MSSVSVKLYDKAGRILRLDTTANEVTFFHHHRKVEQRDGNTVRKLAPKKKTIYSLIDLRDILLGCNRRYLEFLSTLNDCSSGQRDLADSLSRNQHPITPSRVLAFSTKPNRPCCAPCNDLN